LEDVRNLKKILKFCSLQFALCVFVASQLFAFTDDDIARYQKEIAGKPVGERIALWAERFVRTPYDPDPLGEYVMKKAIVADERVDCMYLSFRTVELALSRAPEEALHIALDKRFVGRGMLDGETVTNYEDRFRYGEDMLDSGKWGEEITGEIGPVSHIRGARGREKVAIVPKKALLGNPESRAGLPLKSGDFIFFVKSPDKRIGDEIVGHIGIIKREGDSIYLVHASGRKNEGGEVRKVLFRDYVRSMPFEGVRVGRFP
jgi:hypothetical protein